MRRCRGNGAWLLVLTGLSLSCAPEKELQVEYSRCYKVYTPGPVCSPWPTGVNLWLPVDPGTKVEIRFGDQLLAAQSVEEIQGGRLYRKVAIPAQAGELTVSIRRPDGRPGPRWSLAVAPPEIPPWIEEIKQLGESGRQAESHWRLLQLRRSAPRREQGAVLSSLAESARRAGDNAGRESFLQQGIAADRADNCLSGEVEKKAWLAGLYLDQGRFRDAQRTLSTVELPSKASAAEKFMLTFSQGRLADRVGDYRSALAKLREAIGLAERVRRTDLQWLAEQTLADLLQHLGRSQEELFARLRADAPTDQPCELGDLLTTWGWSRFLARETDPGAQEPTPLFEEALPLYARGCAPEEQLNAHLNLALAHQQAGRWAKARQILGQIRPLASQATLEQRLWLQDLEARIAIAAGDPARALLLYEKLEDLAARGLSYEGRFRASLGQAHAQLALNRKAAALKALAAADHHVAEQTVHVPAHEGRETLVAQREEATRLHLSLLLDDGQRQEAFELARRARSRLLRQLSVRDLLTDLDPAERLRWVEALERYRSVRDEIDRETVREWELPGNQVDRARESRAARLERARNDLDLAVSVPAILADDESPLAPPRPGEVILTYHALPHGWVGFAADEQGIEVSTFELPAGEELTGPQLARLLLEPFRPALERAERVRVLPSGRLRSADFHSLPFDGRPLLARRLVVYGLDLPPRPAPLPPPRRTVLLVADPQRNLLAARQEAIAIAGTVHTWGPGWALTRLDGSAAQAQAVRAKLPGAGLFHYAGHGLFAGLGGWDSELLLAERTRLTLGDVLALRPAPDWVMLSSCDVGRSSVEAPGEGVGLAHAFLLAGSRAVIAATRKVPDRTARDLMTELYRGWHPGLDLPRHFQRAQQACGQRHRAADCASFRLLEP